MSLDLHRHLDFGFFGRFSVCFGVDLGTWRNLVGLVGPGTASTFCWASKETDRSFGKTSWVWLAIGLGGVRKETSTETTIGTGSDLAEVYLPYVSTLPTTTLGAFDCGVTDFAIGNRSLGLGFRNRSTAQHGRSWSTTLVEETQPTDRLSE